MDPVGPGRHHVVKWNDDVVLPRHHVVKPVYHVVSAREDVVKWNYHVLNPNKDVVKLKSDMVCRRENVAFSPQPLILTENGENGTVAGRGI